MTKIMLCIVLILGLGISAFYILSIRETLGSERFTGVVEFVRDNTASDGICTISVDGKNITIAYGGLPAPGARSVPMGKIDEELKGTQGRCFNSSKIGSRVEVFAKKEDTYYTLSGSNSFYVRIKQ